jgi:hypothetical protein
MMNIKLRKNTLRKYVYSKLHHVYKTNRFVNYIKHKEEHNNALCKQRVRWYHGRNYPYPSSLFVIFP